MLHVDVSMQAADAGARGQLGHMTEPPVPSRSAPSAPRTRRRLRSPSPQRSAQRYLLWEIRTFPELQRPSRRGAEKRFLDIRYWNEPERGGHFAAFERPKLFVDEVRAFFRLVR